MLFTLILSTESLLSSEMISNFSVVEKSKFFGGHQGFYKLIKTFNEYHQKWGRTNPPRNQVVCGTEFSTLHADLLTVSNIVVTLLLDSKQSKKLLDLASKFGMTMVVQIIHLSRVLQTSDGDIC